MKKQISTYRVFTVNLVLIVSMGMVISGCRNVKGGDRSYQGPLKSDSEVSVLQGEQGEFIAYIWGVRKYTQDSKSKYIDAGNIWKGATQTFKVLPGKYLVIIQCRKPNYGLFGQQTGYKYGFFRHPLITKPGVTYRFACERVSGTKKRIRLIIRTLQETTTGNKNIAI